MIVRFTTGQEFAPGIQARVDIFRDRRQMKQNNSIYTGLEPLNISARNAALKVKFEGAKEVDIIFNGYLPEHSRDLVISPFRHKKIAVSFQGSKK